MSLQLTARTIADPMNRYDREFLDQLHELMIVAISRRFWFVALLSVIPTALFFRIDSAPRFFSTSSPFACGRAASNWAD
ncbi:MAG: hypothetical protein K2W33_06715 [Burkholderiales bacterium]|nr:hypothetical protein [Burkholderiales bacterium]